MTPVLSLLYSKGIITNKLKLVMKADELELWIAGQPGTLLQYRGTVEPLNKH